MDRARPFPDAARSIVTLSNPQTPFAESATHRRKALRKALFRLVRGCYSPRRRRKRTVAHADKPRRTTRRGRGGRLGRARTLAEGIGSGTRTFVMVQSLCEPCGNPSDGNLVGVRDSLDRRMRPFCERPGLPRFFACYAHSSSVRLDVIATRCAHF